MTRFTRFALIGGVVLAALATAGCQQDDGLAGPSARTAAAAGTTTPKPPADDNAGGMDFVDSYGHHYTVSSTGNGGSLHSIDGVPYAQITPVPGGSNVAYLSGGTVLMQQFLMASPPAPAPGLRGGAGRPMQQQILPCTDEIQSYIGASGGLVGAALALRIARNPTTVGAFTLALNNWFTAWVNMYNCYNRYYNSAAPVTPR